MYIVYVRTIEQFVIFESKLQEIERVIISIRLYRNTYTNIQYPHDDE